MVSKTIFLSSINTYSHLMKNMLTRYKGYSSTLFEVLIKTENILFLNTINILMEYISNSYII